MRNGAWLSQVPRENLVKVLVEERNGGNFTCHNAAGEYLNHTLVLVQEGASMNTILQHSDGMDCVCARAWTCVGYTQTDRDRERERERETDRQTKRETDRQTERKTTVLRRDLSPW